MADLIPVMRRVLLIVHDPILKTRSRRTLRHYLGWNDPDRLAEGFIADVRECSYGYANYQVVERIMVDGFPPKADGFTYDERSYLRAAQGGQYHSPDGVDYPRLIRQFNLLAKVAAGAVDEVWLFGFPYAGYYESVMAGPGAFWCNGPAIEHTEGSRRRFVIMGFSYERGMGEMLEDLGHRAEAIMTRVFAERSGAANLFERFTRYDLTSPGRAECGNVHFAPNSRADYDWGNRHPVPSLCDTWYAFPELSGEPRLVDCREWGNGDIRAHHRWWLTHFPHLAGSNGGISWNWWEYVIDPNRVPV